ncbi:MAG: hypothetical protein AABZ06_02420 [Bdellovibrionota bacterium]
MQDRRRVIRVDRQPSNDHLTPFLLAEFEKLLPNQTIPCDAGNFLKHHKLVVALLDVSLESNELFPFFLLTGDPRLNVEADNFIIHSMLLRTGIGFRDRKVNLLFKGSLFDQHLLVSG